MKLIIFGVCCNFTKLRYLTHPVGERERVNISCYPSKNVSLNFWTRRRRSADLGISRSQILGEIGWRVAGRLELLFAWGWLHLTSADLISWPEVADAHLLCVHYLRIRGLRSATVATLPEDDLWAEMLHCCNTAIGDTILLLLTTIIHIILNFLLS